MVSLNKLFNPYNDSQPFHHLINFHCYIDQYTPLTKTGDPVCVLALRGPDIESLKLDELASMTAKFRRALAAFGPGFIVTSYLIKRANPPIDEEFYSNAFVNVAVRSRRAYLMARGHQLSTQETYLVVIRKADWQSAQFSTLSFLKQPWSSLRGVFSTPARAAVVDVGLEQARVSLRRATNSFIEQCSESFDVRVLDQNESFGLLRRLLNPDRRKADAVRLQYNRHVDFQAVDSELECHRNHLRLGEAFVKVLTIKELPARSFAHILGKLAEVSTDLVVASEWRPLEPSRAIAEIRSKRRHFHNSKTGLSAQIGKERPYERELLFDDSKEALAADLGRCLEEIEMLGTQIGEWSQTFVVQGLTLEAVERASAEIVRIVGAHEGAVHEETYNSLNAFLAALPGGTPFNLRKLLVTDKNHVDLGLWSAPCAGEPRNTFLRSPALISLETEQRSLFNFNFHVDDVGHAFVLGRTGSGKSFLLNCLLVHAQKYRPYTLILDVGGSYQSITRALGGSYISVGPGDLPFSINPFLLEPTPANRQFQFTFTKHYLIEPGGHRMNEDEDRELFDAIEALSVLDRDQRRLGTLATTVGPAIGKHLRRWTEGEQFGSWFDHVEDTVSFARFQCFNFEGIDKIREALPPLLFYILHRADDIISDPSLSAEFKLCVVDEAWRFCANSQTLTFIETALRTWRKKNAAMILATQAAGDLTNAAALRPILDNCPTQILLANPKLDAPLYGDVLRLTESEQDRVRNLTPKRQFLLKQGGVSKVLNLNVDERSRWLYTTDAFDAKRRDEAIAAAGSLDAALDILAGASK
jgi:type IV secretion/conjugal transfer VirB4 family ATPase